MVSGKKLYKYLLLLGSVLILSHCSVEKNTGLSRFYQSLTSRDNIYFNGIEAFKAGVIKAEGASADNFSEILNVFSYSSQASVQACSPNMETAIQKASKVISLKSITARPESRNSSPLSEKEKEFINRKEFNEWVDDSYLLMAKARFYKHEFDLAESTFSFCVSDANELSIRTEAGIWLARINNETANYSQSERILSELDQSAVSTRKLKTLYFTTLADLFIKQKKYAEAIDPLTDALANTSGKKAKYRLTYLLAQLNQETGNNNTATSLYKKVVRMNPPYEVEFNALINIAGVFDISSGDPDEIKKELGRMLKDSKNKEFLDQIYFVLGELAVKEGKEAEAIEYYHKSAGVSTQNQNQKGKSYLAMAKYYYDKPEYLNAQKYYDSAVIFLDAGYPGYQLYKTTSASLNELVSHLVIVQNEDSLQMVASMNAAERNSLIAKIINQVTIDEMSGFNSPNAELNNLGEYYENERRLSQITNQEGSWYFYNQASMTFGRTEFRRRWGDRKLEDNWRRSNKSTVEPDLNGDNETTAESEETDSSSAVLDNKNPDYYLIGLPMNDSLVSLSDYRIATALFNAGRVYSERIEDNIKAVETYQQLLTRFPENELVPETIYNIYNILKGENDPSSEKYRQMLLGKYAGTEYALIISDPDYYNRKKAELSIIGKLYEEAYNTYLNEDFIGTVTICNSALETYKSDVLTPKFLLLKAYATARIRDERAFREELTLLIKQWPGSEESTRAEEIISFLNAEIPELKVEEDKIIATELYTNDKESVHLFAIVIKDPVFNMNQAIFDVINFNIDNYTNSNYRTQGSLIDENYILITVGNFANSGAALDYFRAFDPLKTIRNSKAGTTSTFIINSSNLQTFNSDKDTDRYMIFFRSNYLNLP